MAVRTTIGDIADSSFAEARRLPRWGLLYLLSLGVAWEAVALLMWSLGSGSGPVWICALLVSGAGSIAFYAISMTMISAPRTFRGFTRYVLTALILTAPLFLVAGLLVASARWGWGPGPFVALIVGLLGVVFSAILTPWPLMQATSPRVIGPREAFRRTRGMRWALVLTVYFIGTMDRLLPNMAEADTLAKALFTAGLGVGVNLFGSVALLALSVAAWKRMN